MNSLILVKILSISLNSNVSQFNKSANGFQMQRFDYLRPNCFL